MATDVFHSSVSYLSSEAETILSRLNAERLFFSKGPTLGLPRDKRGLAILIGLQVSEKLSAMKVLEIWVRRDENSKVHHLLRYLERLDRYDLVDDLLELAAKNRLVSIEKRITEQPTSPQPQGTAAVAANGLTIADLVEGCPVLYDAAVLHADADPEIEFANTLIENMTKIGFRLFRKDDLLCDVMPLAAMAELINTRCRYIVVILSRAFSRSPDDQFLSQYVHAKKVSDKSHQMILCEFETCDRSLDLKFYRPMRVKNNPDFWWRLACHLNAHRRYKLSIPSCIRSVGRSPACSIAYDPTPTSSHTARVPVADDANAHAAAVNRKHSEPDVANKDSSRPRSVTGAENEVQPSSRPFNNNSVPDETLPNESVTDKSVSSESVADNFVACNPVTDSNYQVANGSVAGNTITDGPHQPTNYSINIQVISEYTGIPNGRSSQPLNIANGEMAIAHPSERPNEFPVKLRSILENFAQWCRKQSRVVRNRLSHERTKAIRAN